MKIPIGFLLLTAICFAQTPAFEVLSLKESSKDSVPQLSLTKTKLTITQMPLATLIWMGYNFDTHRILGPDWIKTVKFDLIGVVPAEVSTPDVPGMIRTALEERFHLKVRKEQHTQQVLQLIAKNGSRLKQSVTDGLSPSPSKVSIQNRTITFDSNQASLTELTSWLETTLGVMIINETNLSGKYAIVLSFSVESLKAFRVADLILDAPSPILDSGNSLDNQLGKLGLELKPKKVTNAEFLVIDHIDRVPIEN